MFSENGDAMKAWNSESLYRN